MPVVEPARGNNFGVLLWDVQGPAFWGVGTADRGAQIAADVVGGLVANLANMIFGGFQEVTGLDVQLDIETYKEVGNNYAPLNFTKPGKYSVITLRRGATTRTDLWDWHNQVLSGRDPVIRKSGLIIMFDRGSNAVARAVGGNTDVGGWLRVPLGAWYIERALPEKVEGPSFKATEEAVAFETVTLRHQGVTRVSLGMIPGASSIASAVGGLAGLGASAGLAGIAAGVGGT